MAGDDVVGRVLRFWFGEGEPRYRQSWFTVDPSFDVQVRDVLLADHEAAVAGRLDRLAETPEGSLALCILLDQVPRNVFRGTPRAFASDGKALAVARHAVAGGQDERLHPVQRPFLYLPFEHSEKLADQETAVALFRRLGDALGLDYALRHRDVIARFGRFPHRNAILGRPSTPEELAFLSEPGSSF